MIQFIKTFILKIAIYFILKEGLKNLSNEKQYADEVAVNSQLVTISLAILTIEGRGQNDVIGQDELKLTMDIIEKTQSEKVVGDL